MKKILFLALLGAVLMGCSESPTAPDQTITTSIDDTIPPPSDCYVWTDSGMVWVPCNR